MWDLQHHWYRRSLSWLTFFLLPFSYIFRFIVILRLFLYKHTILKIIHFPVPIIVIGNLTVGGTGKTPLVICLAHFLKAQGWRPGIVSRGSGGKKQVVPLWVDAQAEPVRVGDEALLLARHSTCPVVICIDRVAAVKELLNKTNCDVVLADDGLQHYRLGRRIEIAVLDGDRKWGNGFLLPAGPLREAPHRLNRVDFIVQQGGGHESAYFQMRLQGNEFVSIIDLHKRCALTDFNKTKIHAVAGIGNPQRFFTTLRESGLDIIEHIFPDHYLYQEKDFNFPDQLPIVMTEKDKVKCEVFADDRFWYLPVVAVVPEKLKNELLSKLS
ncbi:MAG: lpxK [Gammaproteobacteria bacterium]|jgi:tetraacyldisaccharide 4'-kinase|nr:lpxK [Gammaproteobacteria bacterium]